MSGSEWLFQYLSFLFMQFVLAGFVIVDVFSFINIPPIVCQRRYAIMIY